MAPPFPYDPDPLNCSFAGLKGSSNFCARNLWKMSTTCCPYPRLGLLKYSFTNLKEKEMGFRK
jgi:hypothetical protein